MDTSKRKSRVAIAFLQDWSAECSRTLQDINYKLILSDLVEPINSEKSSSEFMDASNETTGSSPGEESVSLSISHHSELHTLSLPASASIADLASLILAELDIPVETQKLLISGKGLLKPPFSEDVRIDSLPKAVTAEPVVGRKKQAIKLLAPTQEELASLIQTIEHAKRRTAAREAALARGRGVRPARAMGRVESMRLQEESQYTFHDIRPLDHHRKQESLAILYKLRDDPGIKAAMRKHQFTVGLLTEMDPALHTTHESRTLGLNRNKGEIIELRLLTDDRSGMRDYMTIRRTLCHELTHNVWGEHDRNFWDLCKQIEKEVERNDFQHGGQRMTESEYYEAPENRDEHIDGGRIIGGVARLGGEGSSSAGQPPGSADLREQMARAAEERQRRNRESKE